jgi:hypothetical protein
VAQLLQPQRRHAAQQEHGAVAQAVQHKGLPAELRPRRHQQLPLQARIAVPGRHQLLVLRTQRC